MIILSDIGGKFFFLARQRELNRKKESVARATLVTNSCKFMYPVDFRLKARNQAREHTVSAPDNLNE